MDLTKIPQMEWNIMRDEHSGSIIGLLSRNEKFIWVSIGLFFGPMIVSYLFTGFLDAFLAPILQNFQQKVSDGTLKLETLSLFLNNATVITYIYVGGLLFGVISAFYLIIQGVFIGYVAAQYPLSNFIVYTIPHGIFEIAGIILAGTAGFRLGSIVFNFIKDATKIKNNISLRNQISYLFEVNLDDLKDSLALFIMALVLLIIAAFIEANFTVGWGLFIQSRL